MIFKYQKPKYGDMIRVPFSRFYHYGIYASDNEIIQFGLAPIPENIKKDEIITVLSSDLTTFSNNENEKIEVAVFDEEEQKKKFSDFEIVKRARESIGETGYNILHNNCEHFANYCVFGIRRSAQEEQAREHWKKYRNISDR